MIGIPPDLSYRNLQRRLFLAGNKTPRQIHVTKGPTGFTATRAGGSRSSIKPQATQAAAEQAAKELARQTGGAEVITHGLDGRIRSSDTIAKSDPNPPKDREH